MKSNAYILPSSSRSGSAPPPILVGNLTIYTDPAPRVGVVRRALRSWSPIAKTSPGGSTRLQRVVFVGEHWILIELHAARS